MNYPTSLCLPFLSRHVTLLFSGGVLRDETKPLPGDHTSVILLYIRDHHLSRTPKISSEALLAGPLRKTRYFYFTLS